MAIYQQIVVGFWVAFLIIWAVLARGGAGNTGYSLAHGMLRLALAIVIIVASLRMGAAASRAAAPTGAIAVAGCVICLAGLAFATWARVAMGGQWGMPRTLRDRPELVTAGPFAYVRHPIYSGLAAMFVGTALVQPYAAIGGVLVIGYLLFSARREERDMLRLLPDVYPAYVQRTKRFVPFIF
jgi:protein-S-isoprenylcysteine O-methyltransferase Ste14